MKSFTLLERNEDEIVLGLIGRFWRLDFGLEHITDGSQFLDFDEPGIAKLVMSFAIECASNGQTRLTRTTRVFCPDRRSKMPFAPYWAAIRPASGFIRRRMLSRVKAAAEAASA